MSEEGSTTPKPQPMSRYFQLPATCPSPRSLVELESQGIIDVSLKALRRASKRLGALATAHDAEIRILERIYYKGSNQHRPSLFWRNVLELRRLGRRVVESDAVGLVDIFRLAFYDSPGDISPRSRTKVLKGSWNSTPSVLFIARFLMRFRDIANLLNKTIEATSRAYRSFTLSMQNTAFMSQSVVLIAIAARLNHLAFEARRVVDDIWTAVLSVLRSLEPESEKRYQLGSGLAKPHVNDELQLPPQPDLLKRFQDTKPEVAEVGEVIEREAYGTGTPTAMPMTGPATFILLEDDDDVTIPPEMFTSAQEDPTKTTDGAQVVRNSSSPLTNRQGPSNRPPMPPPITAVERTSVTIVRKRSGPEALPSNRKPKKKKAKRDEIDDIFG